MAVAAPASTDKTAAATDLVIEAIGVTHAYEGRSSDGATGWVHALQDFEISIRRNEFLCILGPSGCGKSSFLRIVSGLMRPLEGEVRLNGRRIEGPGLDRGIAFQEPALFPWLTTLRNVGFGLEMSGLDRKAVDARAREVLDIVGLGHALHLYPYQLSGGNEVHLCLLVLRPVVRHVLGVTELLQRLAQARDVAMPEDAPDTCDEPELAAVAFDVLLGHEADDGLAHGQPDRFHRTLLAQPIAGTVSSRLAPRQLGSEGRSHGQRAHPYCHADGVGFGFFLFFKFVSFL